MDFAGYLDQVSIHSDSLRAAAVSAGPDVVIPTCPNWTVSDLVRHIAWVHRWSADALLADPDGERPAILDPPEGWDELLAWWDEQRATLTGRLRERGLDSPSWVFSPTGPRTAGFWARRQAHETAIHRLDAEHAEARSALPTSAPTLVYDPDFAADGIDEALNLMIPRRMRREPATVTGTVLIHAADAGRAWLVRLRPAEPPDVGPPDHAAFDADATVAGTADAVYRAVWGRPSTALSSGDHTLIDALRTP